MAACRIFLDADIRKGAGDHDGVGCAGAADGGDFGVGMREQVRGRGGDEDGMGLDVREPRRLTRVSIFETSIMMFGREKQRRVSASIFQRIVFSSAEPLLMYSQAGREKALFG